MSAKDLVGRRIFAGLVLAILFMLLWPFALVGVILAMGKRSSYPRYLGAVSSVVLVVSLRLTDGFWLIRLGEGPLSSPLVELVCGAASWALGALALGKAYSATVFLFFQKPPSGPGPAAPSSALVAESGAEAEVNRRH